jgi:hypothetical protein
VSPAIGIHPLVFLSLLPGDTGAAPIRTIAVGIFTFSPLTTLSRITVDTVPLGLLGSGPLFGFFTVSLVAHCGPPRVSPEDL